MVGLVVVSHSRELANALVKLVGQVSSSEIPITVAAGIGENRLEFGTDAIEISEAIQSVYSPDGVLVLMDLGSAVLSAQMAVEFLPPEMAAHIRFCAAPLVEGCIAASVQIGLGSDLDTVCNEARQALLPKKEQIGDPQDISPTKVDNLPTAETSQRLELTLHNLHGLHARPAARFVQTAASFNADVHVTNLTNGKGPVSARSLNSITTLGAVENHHIRLEASGPEAAHVLGALKALVDDNFGEPTAPKQAMPLRQAPVPVDTSTGDGTLQAVPVSEGIAFGPFYRYVPQPPPISQDQAENPDEEWQRLERALEATRDAIRQRQQQFKATIGEADAAIFDAHLLILTDPDLLAQVRQAIFEGHKNSALAWKEAAFLAANAYRNLDDTYLQQRAADVEDVANQVLFTLAGKATSARLTFAEPVILYAQDITPTETAQLDMNAVLGILTVGGGPTSHSAILARALGVPAISGASVALASLPNGTRIALDGTTGKIWVEPAEDLLSELKVQRQAWLAERQKLLKASSALAVTSDGHRVEVFANVGNVQDAQAAVKNGAEGVGLLRTEFLFLTRETPPGEAEQLAALRQIGSAMGNRPVTVRTLDVGGDKEVPYIKLPPEPNPFLGVRAIRMTLRNPDIFLPQLRAILRAAADFPFRIMFPMIANIDEVRQARACLATAHQQLVDEKLVHAWPIETGIMVEIPSAALLSHKLAREVDFFSIGTNDLTQYTLAAERGNPLLSDLADAMHPAVLRLIGEVAQAAHAEGKWAGVCGELGGDPLAVPVLIGLGIDELSMNPGGIPRIKSIIHTLDTATAKKLSEGVLNCESAAEARKLAKAFLG
ncbi:MAG TPA: phosphoenolpyruvate--protein phosphotransferase [Anaerolineales bacterium]|jgi:phosphocarrier protein FPr